jgi:UDP-N-acetylglucosamine 1-carboxyvinyltransferase
MEKLLVDGGTPLHGTVRIGGAKNSVLPLLAASLLAPGEHRFANVPDLVDVSSMLSLLGRIGCPSLMGPVLKIDTSRVMFSEAPYDLVRKMRASVLTLGPLLARCGEAHVSLPGGCAIGVRPIDQHLKGLEALGCSFRLEGGYVHGRVNRLRGASIRLDMPTVTGTENILMAAVLAEGETVVENAAREPEVRDLCQFLRSLGACIDGEGTDRILIQGRSRLAPGGYCYSVIPDRIEAGTYLVAGAITGGDVTVEPVLPEDLGAILDVLRLAGACVDIERARVRVTRPGPLRPIEVSTSPFPGFPTDMQAQFLTLASLAQGRSVFRETIFENRFMHVAELLRLGARIETLGNQASVDGVDHLTGASVMATDLRASASLVLGGLAARGRSEVLRIYHLDRGYENLEGKLAGLGARIQRVSVDQRERPSPGPLAS